MKDNITQADLDLAINYMVIERVARCMGVYDYWEDEYEGIGAIFSEAQRGSLSETFKEIEAGSKERLEDVLNILRNLTGLPNEVLLGKRQITLGISVDKTKPHAVELSKMSMDELNEYIEDKYNKLASKNPNNLYTLLPWFNDAESENAINKIVTEHVGKVKAGQGVNLKDEVRKWLSNPLGLNTLGLYIYLIEKKCIEVKTKAATTVGQVSARIEKIYEKSFSNISEAEKRAAKDEPVILGYITNWKQNIYSIDSIMYSMLRNKGFKLEGTENSEQGRSEYKALDKHSIEFPVPLVWDNKKSDLHNLFAYIWSQDYTFKFSYMQLIEESSIADEIKHHEEDILPILDSKQEIFEELLNGDSLTAQHRAEIQKQISLVEQEIDNIRNVYLTGLHASQQLFDTNKTRWLATQRQSIQAMKSAINITAGMTEEEKEDVTRKHAELDALMRRIEDKANLKDAKAWTRVRNPYYKYISIAE